MRFGRSPPSLVDPLGYSIDGARGEVDNEMVVMAEPWLRGRWERVCVWFSTCRRPLFARTVGWSSVVTRLSGVGFHVAHMIADTERYI